MSTIKRRNHKEETKKSMKNKIRGRVLNDFRNGMSNLLKSLDPVSKKSKYEQVLLASSHGIGSSLHGAGRFTIEDEDEESSSSDIADTNGDFDDDSNNVYLHQNGSIALSINDSICSDNQLIGENLANGIHHRNRYHHSTNKIFKYVMNSHRRYV